MHDERSTHLDLFSGIGGFAIAAERCGWETVAFCEREKFCQRVLQKHWPSVPIIDDIHDLDGREYRGVSLLTGGFPCQPWSQAGKRLGSDDDRALWSQMFRVIVEARPRFVLAENVVGIINLELDDVLSSLEGADYSVRAVVVPACAVDARHQRSRVWILGADNMVPNPDNPRRTQQRRAKPAPTQNETAERRGQWSIEPDVCRVVDGIPDRVDRLRGLGNAIVPQVAEKILMALNDITP